MNAHQPTRRSRIPRTFWFLGLFLLVAALWSAFDWRSWTQESQLRDKLTREAVYEVRMLGEFGIADALHQTVDCTLPDFSSQDPQERKRQLEEFLSGFRRVHPWNSSEPLTYDYDAFVADVREATSGVRPGGLDIEQLDPAEALVFWIGGVPTSKSPPRLSGWCYDCERPLTDAIGSKENDPYVTEYFDSARLVDLDGDGWFEYVSSYQHRFGNLAPYVYLSLRWAPSNRTEHRYPSEVQATQHQGFAALGCALPYSDFWPVAFPAHSEARYFRDMFVILSAGPDGKYGLIPDSTIATTDSFAMPIPGDEDNAIVFCVCTELVAFGELGGLRQAIAEGFVRENQSNNSPFFVDSSMN